MILIAVLFLVFIGVGITLYFTFLKKEKKYKKILEFNPKSYSINYMFDYPKYLPPFSCNKEDFINFGKGGKKPIECKNISDKIKITKIKDVIKDNNEIIVSYRNKLNKFRIIKPTKEGLAIATFANGKNWMSNKFQIYAIEN